MTIAETYKAINITETGGAEVLVVRDLPTPTAVPAGEILVKNFVAGVNYIDTNVRKGAMPTKLPITVGMEGAGVVEAVGEGVQEFQPGNRVAYVGIGVESYAQYSTVPSTKAVHIPSEIPFDAAAAAMMQGLTAHYLISDTYKVKAGDTVLIHAGAGGMGQILTRLAVAKGATVITTVSSEEKAQISRAAGAHHAVNYSEEEWEEKVNEATSGKGVHVVYDSVGKKTFASSFALLRKRGHLVLYGAASGAPDPIAPLSLGPKSISLTRPMLFHYIEDPNELRARSAEVFEWVQKGIVSFSFLRFALEQAEEAHRALEERRTTGKIILEVQH
ncbi:hypothetical protein HDV00_007440 [Rhizophlyctis rosea]|nr:hypothetical protein HDV00_007440 [Rhizophlyctis rosea]